MVVVVHQCAQEVCAVTETFSFVCKIELLCSCAAVPGESSPLKWWRKALWVTSGG